MKKQFAIIIKRENSYHLFTVEAEKPLSAIDQVLAKNLRVFFPECKEGESPNDYFCKDPDFYHPKALRRSRNLWQAFIFDRKDRLYVTIVVWRNSKEVGLGGRSKFFTGLGYYRSGYEHVQIEASDEFDAAQKYLSRVDFRRLGSKKPNPPEMKQAIKNLKMNKKLRKLDTGIWLARLRADHRLFELTLILTRR